VSCWVCGRATYAQRSTCGQFCSKRVTELQRLTASLKNKVARDCLVCGLRFETFNKRWFTCRPMCSRVLTKIKNKSRATSDRKARRYGLSSEAIASMLDAGCYAPECKSKKRLSIDHDHGCCPGRNSCGKCVRGVLCQKHNLALGVLENNYKFVVWAIAQPNIIAKEEAK
jgi:predicted nucleic acid-binding Zn ribbon protein